MELKIVPAQLNDRALRRLKVHTKKRVNFGCPVKGFFEISHLHISHSASYLPPKILHNLCFYFSWVLQPSQEKLKTMLTQDFGGR